MDFGPAQIAIVLIIGLLVFGPRRLPELGKSLGSGLREFKDSVTPRAERQPTLAEADAGAQDASASTESPVHVSR